MKVKLFPPFFTMLSTADLERLITVKRLEIEKEKTALGLSPPVSHDIDDKENVSQRKPKKQVSLAEKEVLSEYDDNTEEKRERESKRLVETEDYISPDLERYIRRYLGLPVMLKAGEYSPNNPLIRGERPSGDVLLGLGEYERRRNTLRKLRQQQYREYLDQQAKKKQDAKEQAEKERREQEEKERQREEEKERQREEEIERQREKREQENRTSQEFRRASTCYVTSAATSSNSYKTKVDTGVQVGISRPLSVAVQTDDSDLYRLTPSPTKSQLTQAERELSPRTVEDPLDERPVQPAPWLRGRGAAEREEGVKGDSRGSQAERRRSYGDFDERSSATVKRTNRDKLQSDLRHTYMPSIFDADAIQRRNVQAEKDAAERRQFYQQELKSQILEQQRIKEERKTREKMLEQAEMRRLEEQLRMLKVAQEREIGKQHVINTAINDNAMDYNKKRKSLQQEIDVEHQKLIRVAAQMNNKRTTTAHSDTSHQTRQPSKLPFYYPTIYQRSDDHQKPYSTNIPDNSIFSPNYDVDTYLRRNLNPSRETLMSSRLDNSKNKDKNLEENGCEIIEKAIVHERPRKRSEKPKYEPSFMRNLDKIEDETPIPVLKHTSSSERDVRCENDVRRENNVRSDSDVRDDNLSDAMKIVDDKWKVPAVQKNILKSIPNEEGKSVSILTQLGSIRRQLQLEQLKLDNMATKNSEG